MDLTKSRYVREVSSVTWVGGGDGGDSKPGTPHTTLRNRTAFSISGTNMGEQREGMGARG